MGDLTQLLLLLLLRLQIPLVQAMAVRLLMAFLHLLFLLVVLLLLQHYLKCQSCRRCSRNFCFCLRSCYSRCYFFSSCRLC